MIDYSKIQMISSASSNKVLLEGTGAFTLAALPGAGETTTTATVTHSYGRDDLLFQVSTNGAPTNGVMLPWQSNDGRITLYAKIDAFALYITGISSDSSGFGAPGYTISYFYRILIP